MKMCGVSPVCSPKAQAQESRVRSVSGSGGGWMFFGHEVCSAVDLYRRWVLWPDAQDMCRCEETLRWQRETKRRSEDS